MAKGGGCRSPVAGHTVDAVFLRGIIGVVGDLLFVGGGFVGFDRFHWGVFEKEESKGCSPLGVVGRGEVLECVFRRGRGMDPDPKVRVSFLAVVVEVVGLLGRGGSEGRAYL